jgi:hypothetical protein
MWVQQRFPATTAQVALRWHHIIFTTTGIVNMNNEHMKFIYEEVIPRISLMEIGEITDCKDLFDPVLWDAVPPPEHRYVFGHPISMLVAQGKVPLAFAGYNSARHNLYRKIDK